MESGFTAVFVLGSGNRAGSVLLVWLGRERSAAPRLAPTILMRRPTLAAREVAARRARSSTELVGRDASHRLAGSRSYRCHDRWPTDSSRHERFMTSGVARPAARRYISMRPAPDSSASVPLGVRSSLAELTWAGAGLRRRRRSTGCQKAATAIGLSPAPSNWDRRGPDWWPAFFPHRPRDPSMHLGRSHAVGWGATLAEVITLPSAVTWVVWSGGSS